MGALKRRMKILQSDAGDEQIQQKPINNQHSWIKLKNARYKNIKLLDLITTMKSKLTTIQLKFRVTFFCRDFR